MAAERIEREMLIEAPVEVVWRVLTEPEHLQGWFSDTAELDLREGGAGHVIFDHRPARDPVTVQIQVESVEPPHRFSFRWDHEVGVQADENNSLLVEFTLTSEGERTRLRLVEDGFESAGRRDRLESHHEGWDTLLPRLAEYAPAQSEAGAKA
jgi:uncharacterized protein YndB with AHSA1/START domain